MAAKKPGADENIVAFEPATDPRAASFTQRAPAQLRGSAHESLRIVKAFAGLDDPDIRRLFIELMERVAAATRTDEADTPRSPT